ncbi:uncharacterized protein PpBr36_06261 [Pyricularia pennisetigena]|uniref:uncharacterized protein n=1 Tax=Pyricularia pennisetigena TaxID=1578925 RepID=UPI001151D151|nr:uncharacterized protein PpBr36_06261 [Pyricularia pennisetigena]TLS23482.1 hypothetical protein PpBr36_06261 [Pyricularia pennisetigena]
MLPSADQPFWCMCSHHACYHEDVQVAQTPPVQTPIVAAHPLDHDSFGGQENERPRVNREPLTPVQDMAAFQTPGSLGQALDWPGLSLAGSSFKPDLAVVTAPPRPPSPHAHQVAQPSGHGRDASLPDTLPWTNLPAPNHDGLGLPPIPSQCLFNTQSFSTASSQTGYLRPFGGKGLHTLDTKATATPNDNCAPQAVHGPPGTDPDATVPNTQTSSPLEPIPMPSAPTPRAASTQDTNIAPSTIQPQCSNDEAFRTLKDTVQDHGHRLDKLENQSFSVAGHDDCHEKYDQTDLKVTELESRVEEVEKRLNDDNSTVVSSIRGSAISTNVSTASQAFSQSEVYSKLQQLQAQVNRLQASSLPTYSSPWDVEVVVIPFPLKGVWMPGHEFSSQRSANITDTAPWDTLVDEWTQLPNTHSRKTPDPQSSLVANWLDQSASSAWLLPRACAPGRMIDERLRSRGLIKTVSVKGSDARSVQLAITAAFHGVFKAMQVETASRRSSPVTSAMFDKFLGLSLPWVPLRKIHKDSRLRFLSPAEMLTPTLWDVAFLMSSVVMKATGLHRLYITQPEAYVQDKISRDSGSGWTWQRLRELAPALPDSQSSSASTIDAEEDEQCWKWNDRLDQLPAIEPSREQVAAASRSRSTAASSSQVFYTAQSPATTRAKSPVMLRERRGSGPPHLRTASMPQAGPVLSSPAGQPAVARVASYTAIASKSSPYERRPSPLIARPSPRLPVMRHVASEAAMVSAVGAAKRRSGGGRGNSRSPSIRPRNTPRWSTNSIRSRSTSVALRDVSAAPEDYRMRGTTPFCYATPYSTAPVDTIRGPVEGPSSTGNSGRRISNSGENTDYEEYGSGSDVYDQEMTNQGLDEDFDDDGDDDDDADPDFNVYQDYTDEMDDDSDPGDDSRDLARSKHSTAESQEQLNAQVLPEDEVWPGIEDNMSDGENIDPESQDIDIEDAASDISSQPSEYPSTHRAWQEQGAVGRQGLDGNDVTGFRIHEDEDDNENDAMRGAGFATRW